MKLKNLLINLNNQFKKILNKTPLYFQIINKNKFKNNN